MEKDFRKFYRSRNPYKMTAFDDYEKHINGMQSPYIMEERDLHVTQLDIFSRLMMDRQLFYRGEVNEDGASIIVSQLLYLDSIDNSDITMYVATYGGECLAGLSIYDTMQIIKSDVRTVCTSVAASMGSILLSGGTAGKRSALENSHVLIHQPLGGAKGQASDIEIEAKFILSLKDKLYSILNKHSGKAMEDIIRDADRDFWMTSSEALNYGPYGIIDKIITKDGEITRETKPVEKKAKVTKSKKAKVEKKDEESKS